MNMLCPARIALAGMLLLGAIAGQAAEAPPKPATELFSPSEVRTSGTVTVGGAKIAYQAIAGTLVVHAKDWDETEALLPKGGKDAEEGPAPQASMFFTAYVKSGAAPANRPIMFLFNGGPGSASLWLHMGAFGPVRVETRDVGPTAAPYRIVENGQSLLDVADLVFIDAPGTGFSRVAGKDKDKAFYGVDQDIHAFAAFIKAFLSKYDRWASPKYLFGESYGTMRGAGLAKALQDRDIDLNGLILLSDILAWDLVPDDPQANPGVDIPYVVALPTYAATAWYHGKAAQKGGDLKAFLAQVEQFATTDYAQALIQGSRLPEAQRIAMAERLAAFTGLSVPYLLKTDLRITYGAFQQELLGTEGMTAGTLDTRFSGPSLDRLSKLADFDPQGSAIGPAYAAALNSYVRTTLRYGDGQDYVTDAGLYSDWDYRHQPPGADKPLIALPNVLPDLAVAMKRNPHLKVMVNGGYFDISTPYFAGRYELEHMPIPESLRANIEYRYYEAGHMVYVNLPSLVAIHDNVAEFVRRTDNLD